MRMVLAIGGSVVDGRSGTPAPRPSAQIAARLLAPITREHEVVITHLMGSDRSFGDSLAAALREAAPGRVTTSLKPTSLVDVCALLDAGLTVIAPTANDLAAAGLAAAIQADALMLFAEADAVYRGYGTPAATPLRRLTTTQAEWFLAHEMVTPPSMASKLAAATRFAATGGFAMIAALDDVAAALHRSAGTRIVLDEDAPRVPPDPPPRRPCGAPAVPAASAQTAGRTDSVSPTSRRNGGYSSRINPA